MIKPNQIIAARGLLRWSRDDLADASGIHAQTIKKIETGDTDNPRSNTLNPIIEAFNRNGIEFIDGGVREQRNRVRVLEGKDCYLKFLDEIYHTLKNTHKSKEVLFGYADQRVSSQATIESQLRMRNAGITMKFTVKEGDEYLLYPLNEYRYVPENDFLNSLTVIYDDYVSILHRLQTPKITIINDAEAAEVYRRQFYSLWNIWNQPTNTVAEKVYA
jgi:transcriptional regulator with XRE-family HTH domain